jgi:type VI secretion system protein ImpM
MSAPGYFGKVLTRGDFVARRLAPDFVGAWDAWLEAGLLHSQQRLGPRWLDVYLNSPVWHFAVAAGLCGDHAVAGVMIPSVDRVGRYFPLTLAGVMRDEDGESPPGRLPQSLPQSLSEFSPESLPEPLTRAASWFETLERLALGSLVEGFSLEDMDAALTTLASNAAPGCVEALRGRALFWTQGSLRMAPTLMVCTALPSADQFCAMLAPVD